MVHLKEKPNIPNLATMPLFGKQDDIRIKVALCLGKYFNPETKKRHRKAYPMIAEELVQFGVSPYYVGTVWRKHR